jgi:hypothetical protein
LEVEKRAAVTIQKRNELKSFKQKQKLKQTKKEEN